MNKFLFLFIFSISFFIFVGSAEGAYAVNLSGQITFGTGDPVVGARVLVGGTHPAVETDTQPDGSYSLDVIPDPNYIFIIRFQDDTLNPPDILFFDVQKSISITGDTVLDIVVPTVNLSGLVTDPNGNPVAGVLVDATSRSVSFAGLTGDAVGATNTVGDGTYSMTMIPSAYSFVIRPPEISGFLPFVLPSLDVFSDTVFDIELIGGPEPRVIGGTLLSLDTTALLIAGFNANSIWMIPTVLGLVGAGIAIFKLKRK